MARRLPEYPWLGLKPYAAKVAAHPEGGFDLSVGSPVDPTPSAIAEALAAASNAPGYPSTGGTEALREAVVDWFARRRGVPGLSPSQVMPSVGSKELISLLPIFLGMDETTALVQPRVAYTAYSVGADLVGAELVSEDDPELWPDNARLIWLNSPGNPDGRVLDVGQLRAAVERARELGAILASDECYAELGWSGRWARERIPSLLSPEVSDGDLSGLITLYSLSKQSNMAGYRAAFAAGDAGLIASLLNIRMHTGLIMPMPVQRAMVVALRDEAHLAEVRRRYLARREVLLPAVRDYGFEVSASEAGLYLWATLGKSAWDTVSELAEMGILVVPGNFYEGEASKHVRFSLTASDSDIEGAAARLRAGK